MIGSALSSRQEKPRLRRYDFHQPTAASIELSRSPHFCHVQGKTPEQQGWAAGKSLVRSSVVGRMMGDCGDLATSGLAWSELADACLALRNFLSAQEPRLDAPDVFTKD
jgi:hypothetical protein